MASVSDEELAPRPTMELILRLFAQHAYVFVPEAVLSSRYTGKNRGVTGIATWWIRYFDWV
jgi:hypothetical protein